nr:hypothetical protein [Candidatus Ruthturnera calyptogenae]
MHPIEEYELRKKKTFVLCYLF